MKKLQSGDLQSGIYRNFYKSQFKEQTHQWSSNINDVYYKLENWIIL